MPQSALNRQLFVHFGGEARNERFQNDTETTQGVQGSVDNLLAPIFGLFLLVQVPRLELLEVAIAVTRVLHRREQTVLQLDSLHLLYVSHDLGVELVEEGGVGRVDLAWVDGHLGVEGACGEFERAIGEVSKVGEKLVVILGDEVVPEEDSVLILRPIAEQEVPPNLGRNARFHGVISKDARVSSLGELEWHSIFILLVVEELCR